MNHPSNANYFSRARSYGWLVCTLAAIFYCYEFLLRIEPSVMVPELMRSFQVTAAGLGILTAMYYYAYTPLQAVVGMMTDYFGPRRVLITALVLCSTGCLLFGSAHSILLAASGRLLMGVGSAFAFIGALKLAAMWLPTRLFAFFAGITTALGMLGAMVGDISLTHAVNHWGWRNVAMFSAYIGLLLIPLFILYLREHHHDTGKPLALAAHEVWNGFLTVVKNRCLILAGIIGCLLYLSLSTFGELWGIPFLTSLNHLTRAQAASINSMVFLGWLVGAPLMGWLSDCVHSRRLPLIVGSATAAICFSTILIWSTLPISVLYGILFLFGVCSSTEVLCFAIGRDITELKLAATVMGMINFFIMLSGMVTQPLVGILLEKIWGGELINGMMVYSTHAYRASLIIIPIAMLTACLLAMLLPETYALKRRHE